MHCLPATHNRETQAENRLHTIKALMVATVGDQDHESGGPGSSASER
jgi:hypothetical protein